jgi:hypothetical protein
LPNIVKHPASTARHAPPLQTTDLATDELCSQLVSRVMELRAKARSELQVVIGFLDLSLSTTRKMVNQISDPGVRTTFERQLVSIETKLKLAHEKSLDL